MSEGPAGQPVPLTRVGLGILRRGECVLIRRRPEGAPLAGLWEFPGGKCQPGELPFEATRRECREELGLEVEVVRLRRVVRFRYAHAHVELHFHDCLIHDPRARPAENSGFCWVPASLLPSLPFPEANAPVLADLAHEFSVPVDTS
jgi:mutator protein MutT